MEQKTKTNTPQSNRLDGPLAIFWDLENCPVPSDLSPDDVASNIRMAVRVHPIINGAITMFSAYGDFNAFPRRVREGCQRTGVKLIDVPNGRKDAADKAILVDMFVFALDNPPPSSLMLISGDVDFSPALHVLGQRGYTVVLVAPSGVRVSSALSNAGSFLWDWPSVARGEGFVPSLTSSLNDLTCLTGQLVKLLECSGGRLPLGRIPAEYQKSFGRPLSGTFKLVNLLKKMNRVVSVEGKGQKKLVFLKKSSPEVTIKLDEFRRELQEILVSYSCGIFLGCFEAVYQQRYKRPLDCWRFGVEELEELFEKVSDVAVLLEEPVSKKKVVAAAGC